ncbi:MAG: restriction endonuclease [Thermoleophilia bacterium]
MAFQSWTTLHTWVCWTRLRVGRRWDDHRLHCSRVAELGEAGSVVGKFQLGEDPHGSSQLRVADASRREDTLGLDQVVVQAKRYNTPVDVKLIREFAGSLDERGTDKGVFFTTDKFTGPATDFARSIKKRIVLIDGPERVVSSL